MSEFDKSWFKAIAARAGHTFAQSLLASIGASALIEQVDWKVVLSMALMAAFLSFLKSVVYGVPEVTY